MSKVYKHEYECRGCEDIPGVAGCVMSYLTTHNDPWPPKKCPYGMQEFYWDTVKIEEVKND